MELIPVSYKFLLPESLGVLEVQEVNAVPFPDDEIGAPETAATGCAHEGQFRATAERAPALGLELLQESEGVLASVDHRRSTVETALEGLRIFPTHEKIS
jgi:hypothetical protein